MLQAGSSFKLPLTNRGGALGMLGVADWQLEKLVDQGAIRGVINIASAQSARVTLRFLVVALEEFTSKRCVERTDSELAEIIFGKPQPVLRAHWIRSRLLCHETHFYNLAAQRVIPLAPGSIQRCGPGGSATVQWGSLVKFISARRVA